MEIRLIIQKKLLEKYRNKVSLIYLKDDNGIWDAMNKGIKLAER